MRTGNYLIQLQNDSKYEAFVPNNLPFPINLDQNLQSLLSKADLALGRLDGVADILPSVKFLLDREYLFKEMGT